MRRTICLNENWLFSKTVFGNPPDQFDGWEKICLPHTWNGEDGQDGGNDYYRGECWYAYTFPQPVRQKGDRVYVEFEAAAMKAKVYINGREAGNHEGGYSAFRVDITDALVDKENVLCVSVDNREYSHIYPQTADFTFYGGLCRNVSMIIVPETHFDLDYFGAPGIAFSTKLKDGGAVVSVDAYVTGGTEIDSVMFTVLDAAGNCVCQGGTPALSRTHMELFVSRPHLWQGTADPYLYTVVAGLVRRNEQIDQVSARMGIREFYVDPEKGFFLNGISTPLRGVARHQDYLGCGSALTREQQWEDAALISELGANTIRLAHYQHSRDFYDVCDAYGFVVWSEIPFISRMSNDPEAHNNCIGQLKELIYQNYNHPCVCFWGISNEITIGGDSPLLHERLKELNNLAHILDPGRLTAMAHISMLETDNEQVSITDVMSYNHYFGWYGGKFSGMETWMDRYHEKYPKRPVGISEYGAEANITYHGEDPKCKDYSEEYQALYHEHMAKVISKRPYIWATHVWNMFDFGCDARDEGGIRGRNDKGLVTMDRKIKKDAFYIYKSYWSREPFVYICGRRFAQRTGERQNIKVYSNLPSVTLRVNGEEAGTKTGENVFLFEDIVLIDGYNFLEAVSGTCTDAVTLERVKEANPSYILIDPEMEEGEGAANWFADLIVEDGKNMESCEGFYSVHDTIEEILACEEALNAVIGAMYSSSGMKFKRSMLSMMGHMSLLDLQVMVDKASGGDEIDRPPMEAMMDRLNAVLQTIKK